MRGGEDFKGEDWEVGRREVAGGVRMRVHVRPSGNGDVVGGGGGRWHARKGGVSAGWGKVPGGSGWAVRLV